MLEDQRKYHKGYKSRKLNFIGQKGQSFNQCRKKPNAYKQSQPQHNTPPSPSTESQLQCSENWECTRQVFIASNPRQEQLNQRIQECADMFMKELQSRQNRVVTIQENILNAQNEQKDLSKLCSGIDSGKYVGLDCEMVGVGPNGERSVLARACVIDGAGKIVLDVYAKPKERVTNFRTDISGITWDHIKDAEPTEAVQLQVAEAIRGKIVIGHSLKYDFAVLNISHPTDMIRDTSQYPPLMRTIGRVLLLKPHSLKYLAKSELALIIQHGEHTPVDDARAALYIYAKHRSEWEHYLKLTHHMKEQQLLQFIEYNPKWGPV